MFTKKCDQHYRDNQYKTAFKEAQRLLTSNRSNAHSKRGEGICVVVKLVNKEYLPSPNDKKISKGAIEIAMVCGGGDIVSPAKRGRKVSIPKELTYALATHAMMMQETHWQSSKCYCQGSVLILRYYSVALKMEGIV